MIKLGVLLQLRDLSHLKVTTANEVATDLKQRDQGLAQQILDEMLRFERLVQADSRSRKRWCARSGSDADACACRRR